MSKMLVDVEIIRILANILTETGLSEIEIAEKDQRIRVARNLTHNSVVSPVLESKPDTEAAQQFSENQQDSTKHPGAVLSPMIGIAYLTPEPSSPPLVSVGQQVQPGQVVMLIEAMKTFNQIRAHKAGKITRILISSGEPVEYGEALMIIE